jgi:hypothetical protein
MVHMWCKPLHNTTIILFTFWKNNLQFFYTVNFRDYETQKYSELKNNHWNFQDRENIQQDVRMKNIPSTFATNYVEW